MAGLCEGGNEPADSLKAICNRLLKESKLPNMSADSSFYCPYSKLLRSLGCRNQVETRSTIKGRQFGGTFERLLHRFKTSYINTSDHPPIPHPYDHSCHIQGMVAPHGQLKHERTAGEVKEGKSTGRVRPNMNLFPQRKPVLRRLGELEPNIAPVMHDANLNHSHEIKRQM
ncbi:hypothetical protein ANN_24330 [Periplaneta americana]|uniref:Uncharacterized protein n=1 Tax=Periplaneta americana TaxID=6978 RepID=A0ABQ8S353_PERAM|nr:hypothetical protein ANN_24330 [Periplaneta americana]